MTAQNTLPRTRLLGSPSGVRHQLALGSGDSRLFLRLHAGSEGFEELSGAVQTSVNADTWTSGPGLFTMSRAGAYSVALPAPLSKRRRVEVLVRSEEGGWVEVEGWEVENVEG